MLSKTCIPFPGASVHFRSGLRIDDSYFLASMLLCLSSFVLFSGPLLDIRLIVSFWEKKRGGSAFLGGPNTSPSSSGDRLLFLAWTHWNLLLRIVLDLGHWLWDSGTSSGLQKCAGFTQLGKTINNPVSKNRLNIVRISFSSNKNESKIKIPIS